MEGKINGKVEIPSQRDIKISDMLQNLGDSIHKIDKEWYCEGKIILNQFAKSCKNAPDAVFSVVNR